MLTFKKPDDYPLKNWPLWLGLIAFFSGLLLSSGSIYVVLNAKFSGLSFWALVNEMIDVVIGFTFSLITIYAAIQLYWRTKETNIAEKNLPLWFLISACVVGLLMIVAYYLYMPLFPVSFFAFYNIGFVLLFSALSVCSAIQLCKQLKKPD